MAQIKRKQNGNRPKSRKEVRKEQRKEKKARRHEFYTNRKQPGKFVKAPDNAVEKRGKTKPFEKPAIKQAPQVNEVKNPPNTALNETQDSVERIREKEQKAKLELEKQMLKQRKKQLLEANAEEDKTIKRLEKLLNLNKRKSKAIPKSFAVDGLDYLLEVCDSEYFKDSVSAEQNFHEANDDFEEDFSLMTGSQTKSKKQKIDSQNKNLNKRLKIDEDGSESEEELLENEEEDDFVDEEESEDEFEAEEESEDDLQAEEEPEDELEAEEDSEDELEAEEEPEDELEAEEEPEDELEAEEDPEDELEAEEQSEDDSQASEDDFQAENEASTKTEDTWEDIYGRKRGPDGSIIQDNTGKYIPPAARAKMEAKSGDKQRNQKLDRLRKQLKGLLNRLAESNMHNISTQIEELYMNNSRNDMNDTITELILEALVLNVLAPERLLLEHIVLITILHANVGTEVGGHFLQTIVDKFHNQFEARSAENVEDKTLDNLVIILSQLYNFKLFDSKLMYEIVGKFTERFTDGKDVECILHILRNVGFNLRKDDPIALKNLILNLQKRASQSADEFKENARVKFMLDILLAIKNNNVSKIPNYDTTYAEHLKKITKGFIRKGNYVTQLNITLDDLLNVEKKGRWWIVGSAWTGNSTENPEKPKEQTHNFSQKLLDLAKKQRMNTDVRKTIFCIIMSAEDYVDAVEKLLKLSLKSQDREIIHVILHCCMQEKRYNPYYAVLAQKFCEHDRKFQLTIKYSIWDKLKALNEQSASQTSNLAKLLGHLVIEKGLPISTLKVLQFSELDKITLRFMRQILLGILLHEDLDSCREVFEKIAHSDKLKMFRESLRLFIHHFLLKNLSEAGVDEGKKKMLQERARIVEKLLRNK